MSSAVLDRECVVEAIGLDAWREAALAFADHNYRHVWEYGEIVAARNGARCEHVAIRRGDEIIALADVRIRSLPIVGGGIAYVGGGPLTRRSDGDDVESLRNAVMALRTAYVDERGLTLRIMCPLGSESWNEYAASAMQECGFEPAKWPKPYRTIAVRTDRPLDDVRADFSKNWRKNLRRGEQRGVTLRVSQDCASFDHVRTLYDGLLDRKGFDVELDANFYAAANEKMNPSERFTVILAELDGEVCGMNVVSALGDTLVGIIGATTYEGAKRYAAYLLEWAAIELAHERGMVRYDMGGIDPDDNPGGYDFKRGTRGDDLTGAGPFERKPSGLRAAFTDSAERAYRALRRVSKGHNNGADAVNGKGEGA